MNVIIDRVNKDYRKNKALDNVSICLKPGIHGLLGPNGAGKTTLMNILATIVEPDSGEISCDGKNWKAAAKKEVFIGFLPQQFGMYKYMKVEEALKNVAILKKIPRADEKRQIELAMDRTNMSGQRIKKVGQLSGGMLRRLGIAQAILGEPGLLILDEPSVGLDPEERIRFRKMIRDYDDGKRIIIISSHIVSDLESLCERLTIMNLGRAVMTDTVQNIRSIGDGRVQEEFVSESGFRDIEGTHTVINYVLTDEGYRVRYLMNENEGTGNAAATLEDSFAYMIRNNV